MWYKSPVILVLMVGKKQKKAHIDSAIDSTIDNNTISISILVDGTVNHR